MSTIQYPKGVHPAKTGVIKGKLGAPLEKDLNDSNDWYRETGKALVYKKPTPVQVVSVDYPSRNKARITEAYYRTPSTTDYNGVYRGRYIDFEAKETKQRPSFPLKMVHAHQVRHLKEVLRHGGIGFFIIRFSAFNETYLVDASTFITEMEATSRSSIPHAWFETNGQLLREGLYPRLDYLRAVDHMYFKED